MYHAMNFSHDISQAKGIKESRQLQLALLNIESLKKTLKINVTNAVLFTSDLHHSVK